ncbi:hypothetical protein Cgig2_006992 [Carnegiea gigantea]|uniref:SANTA domain-containing protein n=1 Tax=Carnegiea gigantea TaxID=171969 RepID=A0A9Q1GNP4_9CARY|nr:hypothetical protein Cgig2_015009 [Carnegiea gigantea]KAJ8439475.1 hypothetical protein Cgig2_006992 [Carnegiea gigantea]
MEAAFSPIVKKIAGEVVGKRKRDFRAPTDVCLEDWWLSKPDGGKGIAVGGRPVEMRRCDNARKEFHCAPTKKRYASREFHSAQVVQRHSCTTVETSDGLFVYLCGFINRSRTQQNGFSSEVSGQNSKQVCRDFLYGFPLNWEDHAAKCVGEETSQSNLEYFSECFLPAALDAYNGAQLHDMVLSLTDAEREILNKKMYNNIMGMLNPEMVNEIFLHPSKPSPLPVVDKDIRTTDSTMRKVKNKQQRNNSMQNYREQDVGVASVSSCTSLENQPSTSQKGKVVDALTSTEGVCRTARMLEDHETKENVTISPKASLKQGPLAKPARKIQTSNKDARESVIMLNNAGIERNVNVSCKSSLKKGAVDRTAGVARTSRDGTCKSMSSLESTRTVEDVIASKKLRALRSAKRNVLICNSTQVELKTNVKRRKSCDQSEVRLLLENLTSIDKRQKGKSGIRMLKELLY